MNDNDMSDVIQQMSKIINEGNIPDNMKDIINNLKNSSSSKESTSDSSAESSDNSSSSGFGGIDFDTIMKMKSIMDKMNSKEDPRANLLRSLKPYLKDSRKNKVDQYIQLFNMTKVLDVLNPDSGKKAK